MELEHIIGFSGTFHQNVVTCRTGNRVVHAIGHDVVVANLDDQHDQQLMRAHDANVSCLATSKCGRFVASGQRGSRVRKNDADVVLWNLEDFSHVTTFSGMKEEIVFLDFTPDSLYLIAIDESGLFQMWDAFYFELILATRLHNPVISALVIGSEPGKSARHLTYTVYLSTNNQIVEWKIHYDIYKMQYEIKQTPFQMSTKLVGTREFRGLSVFQPAGDGLEVAVLQDRDGNASDANSDAKKPSSKFENLLFACAEDIGEVWVFDRSNYVVRTSFPVCAGGSTSCCVLKDCILVGGGDGTVTKFDLSWDERFHKVADPCIVGGAITSIVPCLHSDDVFVGSSQSRLCKVNPFTLEYSTVLEGHTNPIIAIDFADESHLFATLTQDGTLSIWNIPTYLSLGRVSGTSRGCSLLFISHEQILVGYEDGSIICWQFSQETNCFSSVWSIQSAHRDGTTALMILDSSVFLSGGGDGVLCVWSLVSQTVIGQYAVLSKPLRTLSQDIARPEWIHVCGDDKEMVTFDMRRESIRMRHRIENGYISEICQRSDQDFEILATTTNGTVITWDPHLTDAQQVLEFDPSLKQRLSSLSLSTSNRHLAIGGSEAIVQVVDLETCTPLQADLSVGHSEGVNQVKWTPDNRQIVSVGDDSFVCVWNFYC